MKIEPGFYIKRVIHIKPDEETMDDQKSNNKIKYYLIISACDNQVEVLVLKGSPPINSQVLTYDDVISVYNIKEIPVKNVKTTPVNRKCKINSLDGYYQIATKFEWDKKEFIHPLQQTYWNGYEWIDNSDFYTQ